MIFFRIRRMSYSPLCDEKLVLFGLGGRIGVAPGEKHGDKFELKSNNKFKNFGIFDKYVYLKC